MNCCEWDGALNKDGYGIMRFEGTNQLVHRLAYCDAHGLKLLDIKGKVILHSCDNPPCIEPEHLVLGTQADNLKDMWNKGRGYMGGNEPKLTVEQQTEIKLHYQFGSRTHGSKALGRKYGVSHTTIFRIFKDL